MKIVILLNYTVAVTRSVKELRSLHCLFVGHNYLAHLNSWLTSAANCFHPDLGIVRIGSYTSLTYPGDSMIMCKDTILYSFALQTANIIVLDLAGNDLDDRSINPIFLVHWLISFLNDLRRLSPCASIVFCSFLGDRLATPRMCNYIMNT